MANWSRPTLKLILSPIVKSVRSKSFIGEKVIHLIISSHDLLSHDGSETSSDVIRMQVSPVLVGLLSEQVEKLKSMRATIDFQIRVQLSELLGHN